MLENNLIPPHCGIKTKINHTFPDLEARNVHITLGAPSPWKRPARGKRSLFLNNFSAAGGNTSLLIEDGPLMINAKEEDPRSTAVVAVSGKTKTSLIQNVENLVQYLDENQSVDLPSLSYTTTARRIHYAFRVIVSGSDVPTIKSALKNSTKSDMTPIPSSKSPVVFAFTGQGSHYSTMGREFFETIAQFRSDVEGFDNLAQCQGFPSILPLIDGSAAVETLSPVVVQVGAVCIQMALVRLWASWGIRPAAVIGHSLGEYAALYATSVLSASDTIFLTGTRAKLLDERCTANTHAMLAVAISVSDIGHMIDESRVEIACINGPMATVVSGKSEDIDLLYEDLTSQKIRSTKLQVPFAFHSSQVDPILEDFEQAIRGVTFNTPDVPIISPLLGAVVTDNRTFDAAYFARHCRLTVNFLGGVHAARENGVLTNNSLFVEIGSHPVCSSMLKATLGPSITSVPSLRRGEDAWKVVSGSLCTLHMAGLDIEWTCYHQDFLSAHDYLRLPTYAWENRNYWIDYKNNWTLTKGETLAISDAGRPQRKILSTTSVQRTVVEKFESQRGSIITETDISHPDFAETIKGHVVNGIALCSSAVYADMALTVADYMHRQLEPRDEDFAMDCSRMVVERPLIAKGGSTPQLLHTSCVADLSQQYCEIMFYSVNADGEKTVEHAKCTVKYSDATKWSSEWVRQTYLIQPQVDRLLDGALKGDLSRLQRNTAYKLFSALVDYQDVYKGMAEVVLDSPSREGTARVELSIGKSDEFFMPPYHIDSLCHLAGFIMNGNDEVDSTKTVFVNHGWESLRFIEKPLPNKLYRSYVRMQPTGPSSKDYAGDVYIFDEGGRIIGKIGGLEFQYLPKQILDRVLPPAGAFEASTTVSAKNAAPKPQRAVSKPAPKPKAAPEAVAPNVTTQVLEIMAEEIGLPISDLADDNELSALGVDSLLSLTIAGKFREILDIEVPSTAFSDWQTIKEVREFFGQHQSADSEEVDSSTTAYSGTTTPTDMESMTSLSESDDDEADKGDDIAAIRDAISQETGVPASEIVSSTNLADSGIDSLMSLQILGSLREERGLELSPSFFTDHQTFGDIEKARSRTTKSPAPSQHERMPTKQVIGDITANKVVQSLTEEPSPEPLQEISPSNLGPNPPPARSILLQGSLKTATQTLFLFPDGSGSATSYASIPPIAPSTVALIGLNCPFMKDPTSYTCGIDGVVSLYVAEIQRRQPRGPYYLGGWSAGGVCAYEACLQLHAMGQTVERLIFFDAPCPVALDPLPSRLHHFFDSIGLLGTGGKAPDWLLPHFEYSIRNLDAYDPSVMDPARGPIPKTYSIMAQDGVCKHPTDPRPEPQPDDPPNMNWLLFNRTDFGPGGWEQLLGEENIIMLESIPDVNHFTMMREPGVRKLASRIREALE